MKLTSIENLRKDGKFYDDRGHIPEGIVVEREYIKYSVEY